MAIEKSCAHCGNLFVTVARKTKEQLYCSRQCYWTAAKGPRPDLVTLSPVECRQCLRLFQPRNRYKIFCSRSCAASFNQNPAERGTGKTRIVECLKCGTRFSRRSISNRYCTHECYTSANCGENNATFNGYVFVDYRGYHRYSPSHPVYSNRYVHSVLWHEANPDGVCEDCGGEVQAVHHKDRDKGNNELENLAGLCHSCHRNRHNREDSPYYCDQVSA